MVIILPLTQGSATPSTPFSSPLYETGDPIHLPLLIRGLLGGQHQEEQRKEDFHRFLLQNVLSQASPPLHSPHLLYHITYVPSSHYFRSVYMRFAIHGGY